MSSMYALVACILFHVSAVVPKLYFAVSDGNKSLVIPATILIVSFSSSPIVTLPPMVISPVAETFPVTSKFPVTCALPVTFTLPVPSGIISISAFETVVLITLVSRRKSSTSNVFNAVTLSEPTVVRLSVFEIVLMVLPLILTSPTYAVPDEIKSIDLAVPLMSKSY